MRRGIQILAIAIVALVLQPYDIASGGGPVDPGWARNKSAATSCKKGLLGVGKCQAVLCIGSSCKSVVLPRGTARRARISLGQCISNYDACINNCFLSVRDQPPYPAYFKDCTNRCDANHFVCVDAAMDLSRG
jgi:hypothetical protein